MGRCSVLRQWYVDRRRAVAADRPPGVGRPITDPKTQSPRFSTPLSPPPLPPPPPPRPPPPGGAPCPPHAIVAWPTVTGPCRRCAVPRKVVSIVGARPAAPTEATARSVTANTDGRLPLPTKCTCSNSASRPWAARQISRRKPRTLVSRWCRVKKMADGLLERHLGEAAQFAAV